MKQHAFPFRWCVVLMLGTALLAGCEVSQPGRTPAAPPTAAAPQPDATAVVIEAPTVQSVPLPTAGAYVPPPTPYPAP
ncbi:MAG: hypothetical protein Fur005_19540 [Roseiflexaceae bacterium]